MANFRLFLLALLVIITGLSAGQMFHEMAGPQEALRRVSSHTYVEYWQALDKVMHVGRPILANLVLLVFIVNLITNWPDKMYWPYRLLIAAFIFNIVETLITLRLQLPVNDAIQHINLEHIPANVTQYREATLQHFKVRAALRILAFAMVIFASLKMCLLAVVKKANQV
jgi:uncharacterized membrane protein